MEIALSLMLLTVTTYKISIKSAVTTLLLRTMFFSPVPSTWGVIFSSDLRRLVPFKQLVFVGGGGGGGGGGGRYLVHCPRDLVLVFSGSNLYRGKSRECQICTFSCFCSTS